MALSITVTKNEISMQNLITSKVLFYYLIAYYDYFLITILI